MNSLARVGTIAMNTVREAIRSKLLYVLLFFAIALILTGVFLSALSYVESERILQDIGLAAVRLFSVAIAIFVGVNLIYKDVDRRTVYTILSKPLSRTEFLLGKYVGLVLTIWMQMAIMIVAFVGVSLATGAPLTAAHAAALFLTAVELALVVALATLFSAFTTPMLASFFAGGLWFVGNLTRDLRDIGASSDLESVRRFTGLLHRILPDLDSFNLGVEAAHGLAVTASDVWLPLVYGVGYIAIVLVSASTLFERRDFR
jgi:ABC-type transport system involved in multi-copper enzyme maturation permease subunit